MDGRACHVASSVQGARSHNGGPRTSRLTRAPSAATSATSVEPVAIMMLSVSP